jgi:hypothetical protein
VSIYRGTGGSSDSINDATVNIDISNVSAKGVVYLSTSGAATTVSSFSFDGTKLGLGTNSPSSLLHLTTTNPEIRFDDDDSLGVILMRQSSPAFLISIDPNGVDAGSNLQVAIDGTEYLRFNTTGLGLNTNSPTARLDVNDNTIRVRTARTIATATSTGNAGDIAWDSSYVYVCVATNTWKRAALTTW